MSITDGKFDKYAGQLVSSGVRPNAPVIALEAESNATVFKNLESINGLVPKISNVLIHETKVFNNPVDALFTKYGDAKYGCAIEQAAFTDGADNIKNDGKCVPRGSVEMDSQIDIINWAYDVSIDIKKREVDKAVMNAEQAGSYVAQKMRTPLKRIAAMKYRAECQLLSDVIDGTRTITSSESSDGTGATVSYSPTIKGYAGKIADSGVVLADIQRGAVAAFANGAAATSVVKALEGAASDMKYEDSDYNKLGLETFTIGKPVLVAEEKMLNALDNALALDGNDKRIPTRTAREYIGKFADIVEIDSFASLPANSSYTDKRLGAVLLDREVPAEHIVYADVESMPCAKGRLTGYNWQAESILSMWKGANAYALLFDKQ